MAMRFGISAILLIFPKFLRTRKLLWIVAIEIEPLSLTQAAEMHLAGLTADCPTSSGRQAALTWIAGRGVGS
jgi:hypothetical protein